MVAPIAAIAISGAAAAPEPPPPGSMRMICGRAFPALADLLAAVRGDPQVEPTGEDDTFLTFRHQLSDSRTFAWAFTKPAHPPIRRWCAERWSAAPRTGPLSRISAATATACELTTGFARLNQAMPADAQGRMPPRP